MGGSPNPTLAVCPLAARRAATHTRGTPPACDSKNGTCDAASEKASGVWLKRMRETEALLIQDQPLQLIGEPPVSRIITLHSPQVGVVVLQGADNPLDFLVVEVNFIHAILARRFGGLRLQVGAKPFQRTAASR